MSSNDNKSVEDRLRALEDKFAIQQLVCGYGYAMDGCNAEAVGSLYAEDGEYWVSDTRGWEGRAAIEGMGEAAANPSGRQELFENVMNRYVF